MTTIVAKGFSLLIFNICPFVTLGHGTTHRVNSILIQPGSFSETEILQPSLSRSKRGRRSFKSPTGTMIEDYCGGKRVGPARLRMLDFPEREFVLGDQEKLYLSWVMCRTFYKHNYTPSCTGFNISIRQNEIVLQSSVHYLECIDAPATDISTINEVLKRALMLKDHLKLSSIVCVFDQSIFAKAMEIKWKNSEKYKDCIIMLGTFHTIMMFMAIYIQTFQRCRA